MSTQATKQLLAVNERLQRKPTTASAPFEESTRCFVVMLNGVRKVYETRPVKPDKGPEHYETYPSSDKEKGCPLVLSTGWGIEYMHGMLFQDTPADGIKLWILQNEGFLAPNKEGVTNRHRFFLRDDEAEARANSRRADLTFNAMKLVTDLLAPQKRNLAFFFNANVLTMSETQIDGYIKEMVLNKPADIIKALENRDYRVYAFLNKLVHHRLMTVKGVAYYYGDQLYAIDAATAVEKLKTETDFKEQLRAKLGDLGETFSGSDVPAQNEVNP